MEYNECADLPGVIFDGHRWCWFLSQRFNYFRCNAANCFDQRNLMRSWTVYWYPWRTWDFTDLRMCFGILPWWSSGLPSHSQMTCQYTLPGFCWIPLRKSSTWRSQIAGKEVNLRWLISCLALIQINYRIRRRSCLAVEWTWAFSKEAVIVTGVHVGGLKSYWAVCKEYN